MKPREELGSLPSPLPLPARPQPVPPTSQTQLETRWQRSLGGVVFRGQALRGREWIYEPGHLLANNRPMLASGHRPGSTNFVHFPHSKLSLGSPTDVHRGSGEAASGCKYPVHLSTPFLPWGYANGISPLGTTMYRCLGEAKEKEWERGHAQEGDVPSLKQGGPPR